MKFNLQNAYAFLLTMISILIIVNCFSCKGRGKAHTSILTDTTMAKNASKELSCKLLPEEQRIRKETVLASLRKQVLELKETPTGYAFRFPGNDAMLEELIAFIKTERGCCDFFIFDLSISGDKSEIWLKISGVEGVKDFVRDELELVNPSN